MITEADTCRKYVLSNLVQAGWDKSAFPAGLITTQYNPSISKRLLWGKFEAVVQN